MGPNDAAARRVDIPAARHFGPRGSGWIKCASTPSIDVSPVLRPVEGTIFASVDNGLD